MCLYSSRTTSDTPKTNGIALQIRSACLAVHAPLDVSVRLRMTPSTHPPTILHPPTLRSPAASEGPDALKIINGPDVYCDALPRRSLRGSLSAVYAAPQTLDTARIFIPSSMHIHGQVDGAGVCVEEGVRAGYMSSQCSSECRSRRRMLIQLYGSCSLVPMATVFALEQKSCISSLAIKGHCQARERRLPATRSHQRYCCF